MAFGKFDFINNEFMTQLVGQNLKKMKSIKHLTKQFAPLLEGLSDNITDDLSNLSKIVPAPMPMDFSSMADVGATSGNPIFAMNAQESPQALQQVDPNVLNIKASRQMRGNCEKYTQMYEQAFGQLNSFDNLSMFRRYLKDMYRIMGNPQKFSSDMPMSIGFSMIAKNEQPDAYNDSQAPFKEFDEERKDFSFDGLIPSGLGSKAGGVLSKLAVPEMNLFGWQSLTVNCEKQ